MIPYLLIIALIYLIISVIWGIYAIMIFQKHHDPLMELSMIDPFIFYKIRLFLFHVAVFPRAIYVYFRYGELMII